MFSADSEEARPDAELAPTVVADLPRAPLTSAKLAWEHGGERRLVFLVAKPELVFGRSAGDPKREISCDVILQRLPLRSKTEDPEGWRMNRAISNAHGRITCDPEGVLRAEDLSRSGLSVDGRRPAEGERPEMPELCALALGEDLLVLRARTFRAKREGEALSVGGGPVDCSTAPQMGAENPGKVDALLLRREGNFPQHEYVMLLRQACLGSGEECAIRVPADGIEPVHARIAFYCGEFLLHSEAGHDVEVNGWSLRPHDWAPLAPPATIRIGPASMVFSTIKADDFTET